MRLAPKYFALLTLGIALAASGFYWFFSGTFPKKPAAIPENPVSLHAETDTAARELELQKTRQRIAQLESEIRSTLETHLRQDALRFGLALRDLETILDDYEKGIDLFVEQLHSFSGRFQLYHALGGDLVSFPGKAFQKTGHALQNRASSSHWQTVRSGELLHAIETALQADYGFPKTETVVETMWRQSFDHRVDLAGLTAARIQRLAHELEASRNQLAVEINRPLFELIRLKGLPEIAVHDWLDRALATQVSVLSEESVPPMLAGATVALIGSEIGAYQALKITRRLANRAALRLAQSMAESAAARAGATAASALGSGWATFGISIGVAVVIEITANEISEHRMKTGLREQMRDFRHDFWTGNENSPGIHPQLANAFLDYQNRFVAAFEQPGEFPVDYPMPAVAKTSPNFPEKSVP